MSDPDQFNNDHDLLIRIDTRLQDFILASDKKFADQKEANEIKFRDYEARLRRLERAFYIGVGIIAIVQIIIKN